MKVFLDKLIYITFLLLMEQMGFKYLPFSMTDHTQTHTCCIRHVDVASTSTAAPQWLKFLVFFVKSSHHYRVILNTADSEKMPLMDGSQPVVLNGEFE